MLNFFFHQIIWTQWVWYGRSLDVSCVYGTPLVCLIWNYHFHLGIREWRSRSFRFLLVPFQFQHQKPSSDLAKLESSHCLSIFADSGHPSQHWPQPADFTSSDPTTNPWATQHRWWLACLLPDDRLRKYTVTHCALINRTAHFFFYINTNLCLR